MNFLLHLSKSNKPHSLRVNRQNHDQFRDTLALECCHREQMGLQDHSSNEN